MHMQTTLFIAALSGVLLQAQAVSAPPTRRFEVVSIRRHGAHSGPVQAGPTVDGYRSIGLPLFAIFQVAYALPNQSGVLRGNQIEGYPGWLSNELYDVVAKVDQADVAEWRKRQPGRTMLREMLQAMLTERCKAVTHYASKEMLVYDLVIAKGGPKFKQAETLDPGELRRRHPAAGMMKGSGAMTEVGQESIHFYAIPMSLLANTILSSVADRPVADKTGLSGYYDLTLPASALKLGGPPASPVAPQTLDALSSPLDDESIFTALPDVLGLWLQPSKSPVETLVIDHVERPSEN